jgi:acyl carrier protein
MAAAHDQVLAQTIALISSYVDDDVTVAAISRYDSDLNLDSIQVMDLVAEIEDHFDITIPLNDLPRMQNVAQTASRIVELIDARR